MSHPPLLTTLLAGSIFTFSFASQTPAAAQQQHPPHGEQAQTPRGEPPRSPQGDMQGMHHGDMSPGEMQRMPHHYMPPGQPRGIENRPAFDRDVFNHNYQSSRGHRIGPYRGPDNWEYRRWRFGDILPEAFWGDQYWLGDYWLFGLEVPPVGYEWVRYGPDALLVNITTGEIAQVVYGEFL